MGNTWWIVVLLLSFASPQFWCEAAECTSKLSVEAGCSECTEYGYCVPGTVPVDSWLSMALKTQRELQIDYTFDQFQMLDSHNSFNARAYGIRYGANDTCVWPPPYPSDDCITIGNHEFSIIDQLNLGARGIEIDNWWCYGEMRVCHLGTHTYLGVCEADHMLYSDLIQQIGEWLDQPENQDEILRIYLNEKNDQEHDDEMNGPIQAAFGDRVLTPDDLQNRYSGVWPTIRQMRQDDKHILFAAGGTDGYFTHGDVYIHPLYFDADLRTKLFTSYPTCSGRNDTNIVRVYSDSLQFPENDGIGIYSGEDTVGSIRNLTEYQECRIQYPTMDNINTELMKTAVFTWAEGQPEQELTYQSCVMLKGSEHRWYSAPDCTAKLYYACQSDTDPNDWRMSLESGPYTLIGKLCPDGYSFSIPHDGYQQQQLVEHSGVIDLWLNFSPWLPGPPTDVPTTPSAAVRVSPSLAHVLSLLASLVSLLSTGLIHSSY